MLKIVKPLYGVFCKIETKPDKNNRLVLSITGVDRPRKDGDCDSCGQIDLIEIWKGGRPLSTDWSEDMLTRFVSVWEEYHLNDMQAACEHQRADAEFMRGLKERVIVHKQWKLTTETEKKAGEIKKVVLDKAKKGEALILPEIERSLLSLRPYIEDLTQVSEEQRQFYTPNGTKEETRGWCNYYPGGLGLLGYPCPICGYKYGSAWLYKEIPSEVLDYLQTLPDTTVTPAWV